ncbi:hypothetical protein PS712_03148 [Pseudomonas fluorescens]|uniref:Uncharacterized protein n=1 Tax=Pseudomonas fluorescens TaxID=294 RepID=A0A5E7CYU0_PSEFL|nr:hypothetical protein PS712_03148 [Pseudomonas fluorescens]
MPAQTRFRLGRAARKNQWIVHPSIRRPGRADLQRHRWRRSQRGALRIEHQGFECARVSAEVRPTRQLRQAQTRRCKPASGAFGFDPVEHLGAHAELQSHRTHQAHQQETDQQLGTNFRYDFRGVLGRQHSQPTGESRQMNEHQRLVAQHQQHIGDGFSRRLQELLQFGFGQVFKELRAIGPQIGDQGVKLLHVIPKAVKCVINAAPVGALQHAVALGEIRFGKPGPQRLKLGVPFVAQPAFQLCQHALIGVVECLDVRRGDVGKKGDAIAIAAPAIGDFQDAGGADGFVNGLAKCRTISILCQQRFKRHRRVANRHETRGFKQMHQRQRTAGGAACDGGADGYGRMLRRSETHFIADREHLLDAQRAAAPEIFRPAVVAVEAEAKITEQRFDVRLPRVHRRHHQQADGVVQGQQLVGIKHARNFAWVNGRGTLRWIGRERSRERRCLL